MRSGADPGAPVRRHYAHVADGQTLAEAFVVAEDEDAILLDGTADRAPELVAAEGRHRSGVEEVTRIELAVAEEFEEASVQGVAAGLRDYQDLGSGAFAVCRVVSAGEDVELTDCVDAEKVAADSARGDSELARTRVFDSVEEDQVVHGTAARDGEGVAVAGAGLRTLEGAVVDGPGVEGDQVIEAASVEGELFDLALSDDSGDWRGGGVDWRRLFGDGHLLLERADFESKIYDGGLADYEMDAGARRGGEALLLGSHFLGA